ncbi:uncharacterized protein ACJ7VT_020154 [Polymixia lowei]
MAEESSVVELEVFEKHLTSLLNRHSSDESPVDSKSFCSDFCKLVEEYTCHWQVPLPQLRILEMALCYFVRGSSFFPSNCDHVHYTLSSLSLSVFELLLFFDQKDFHQNPLKHFTVTFQECHLALARHQNVHLLQLKRLVQDGGPWASSALQAILTESKLPQNEVDEYISSELPVFLELRVHYLLACKSASEAMSLARCCARHPTAGQHLVFLQVYLTWLHKTSQHDQLHREVADLSGKDAVRVICSLENEENNELLLALSRAFLSQQLRRGDMYCLWDLVFIWSKLHRRLNTSKQSLLEESRQLMLSATNVSSIFPFIRVILEEFGEEGLQFCVELCVNALQSCLPCDAVTKSLIYKTIASLLPNDLEVCRACALLVFFLERTVEAYKIVFLLYMHPDQDYNADSSPVGNHIRFESLQILKKGLYFDPEFWNLVALRTNCLKLMSEKVLSAALEELTEEKWVPNYCAKEPAFRSNNRPTNCQKGTKAAHQAGAKKRRHKEDRNHMASKRHKLCSGKTPPSVDHAVKKKGGQGTRSMKEASSESFRRSFWQLDKTQGSFAQQFGHGEHRRITRLSEKNPPKRRIRKPRWLLEDSGTLEENNAPPKVKKQGVKPQHQKHRATMVKRPGSGPVKNNTKDKTSVSSHLPAKENESKHQKDFSTDGVKPASPAHIILELSQPDNELIGIFSEDSCNRKRGHPQVLLYKPTVKVPVMLQPVKTVHRKEVILRARDAGAFTQQLHCYARRQKGKGVVSNVPASFSTITRSSVQGSPPKNPSGELSDKPVVEMKVTIASQTPAEAKVAHSPVSDMVSQAQTTDKVLRAAAAKVSQSSTADIVSRTAATDKIPEISTAAEASNTAAIQSQDVVTKEAVPRAEESLLGRDREEKSNSLSIQSAFVAGIENTNKPMTFDHSNAIKESDDTRIGGVLESAVTKVAAKDLKKQMPCSDDAKRDPADVDLISAIPKDVMPGENKVAPGETSEAAVSYAPKELHSKEDLCDLTLLTEIVTELPPEVFVPDTEVPKEPVKEDRSSEDVSSILESTPNVPCEILTTSSYPVTEPGASAIAELQGNQEEEAAQDIALETAENSNPVVSPQESEESKLEYCCTLCNKVFKGKRVVVHAMFHYRRDKCMFCGMLFKDDLLAMMHLSEHIEKLKKCKEPLGNKAQENHVSETQGISTQKKSTKPETTSSSSVQHRGKPKKSISPKPLNLPESTPSASRKLRSKSKPMDGQVIHKNGENMSNRCTIQTPNHKVNGHMGKSQDKHLEPKLDTLNVKLKQTSKLLEISRPKRTSGGSEELLSSESSELGGGSTAASVREGKEVPCTSEDNIGETKYLQVTKTATTNEEGAVTGNTVEMQEKACCPVDGCPWYTDLSKNRVAVLYHALDDHYGDIKPLELAFRVSNSRCSVCMRVLWSFQHYQHHVERHRLTPRHPCLHQGCTARFKTGNEMRRHSRRHSPLQAVCCLPGCSRLFICLWALNLHEREHYASKPTKTDNKATPDMDDKCNEEQVVKKHQGHKPKDATASQPVNAVDRTQSQKAAHELRRKAPDKPSIANDVHAAAPLATATAVLVTERSKVKNKPKDSNVRNLSNKDTSTHTAVPRRSKHKLRKGQVTRKNLATRKTQVSSSLVKTICKMRKRLKKKQANINIKGNKKRGHCPGPTKLNKTVSDEKTIADQKAETIFEEKTDQPKDESTPAPPEIPVSPPETAQTSEVSNELKKEEEKCEEVHDQDAVTTTSTNSTVDLTEQSTSKKSVKKQVKKQKDNGITTPSVAPNTSNETTPPSDSTAEDTQKLMVKAKPKKLHVAKNRSVPKDKNTPTTPSDSTKAKKKRKHADTTEGPKTAKKSCPDKGPGTSSAPRKPAKSKTPAKAQQVTGAKGVVEGHVGEMEKGKMQTSDSTIGSPGYSRIVNGQVSAIRQPQQPHVGVAGGEAEKGESAPKDSPAYGKARYIRLPPTAYLDERYTNMPKRRKEMSMFRNSSPKQLPPEQASDATPPPRQRCANCFISFSSVEELQTHLLLKKCSNLFGFDSDDEGNC